MNKLFLLLLACLGSISLKAVPGDTTTVQAHEGTWLDYYNNFDQGVTFPDGTTSYRKVLMTFTLGKYVCPGSPDYCSDWDYTVQTFLMKPDGDTLELGRLITPYGKGPAMPASWTKRYVFDVTDYYPLLKNDATIRILYSGYSGGFTANIKFDFIEGTPERNVLKVEPLWNGSWTYGKTPAIDEFVTMQNIEVPEGTVSSKMNFIVTGHGSDATGCSEFCQKHYYVNTDGTQIDDVLIWRDDCGRNELYPQSGTWVYDRGGWCPGALVHRNEHDLGTLATGTHTVDVDFQTYSSSTPEGTSNASYTISGAVIHYGPYNKLLDADIVDILSPTNHETHLRNNAACANPAVRVRNSGSGTISSLNFWYSIPGFSGDSYVWNGELAAGSEKDIMLPTPEALKNMTEPGQFIAEITAINGTAVSDDEEKVLSASFDSTVRYPATFILRMITNGSTVSGGVSETSWKIFNADNDVVAQRNGAAPSTTYLDTLTLAPGCYRLEVEDAGCDGVNWWVYASYPVDPGTGQIRIMRPGSIVPLSMPRYYNGDFGCGFTQYFRTAWPVGIDDAADVNALQLSAFPNPATEQLTVVLDGKGLKNGTLTLVDAVGKAVWHGAATQSNTSVDVSSIAPGLYTLTYQDKDGRQPKLTVKVVVAR